MQNANLNKESEILNKLKGRKIVVISNLYPPENLGGYEIGISWISDEIQKQDAKLRIYIPRGFISFSNFGEKAMFHERLDKRMHSIGMGWIGHPSLTRSVSLIPSLISTILIQQFQIRSIGKFADAVLFANPRGIPFNFTERMAKVLNKEKIPYFIYVSDRWVETWPSSDPLYGLRGKIAKIYIKKQNFSFLQKFLNPLLNKFVSKNEIQHLQPTMWVSCSNFIEFGIKKRIGNKINSKVLHWRVPFNASSGAKINCKYSGDCVTFASNVTAEKGIFMLLDALSLINRETHLHIIGDTISLDEKYSQLNNYIKLKIVKEGKKSPIEVSEFLSTYKTILAVPSIWQEPFSIVATQAVVANCPLVITPTGGSPEWKTLSSKGIVVSKTTSAIDFALALSQALIAPDLKTRKKMANFQEFVEDIFKGL